jgi:PAS domain S-box-containing protein
LSHPTPSLFEADDTVGADLARVDWAGTPLGVPDQWPQSLRTAVAILLSSRFPMWMAWGPELTFFCNDAYRRDTLGGKYPWALGRPFREVWAELWDEVRSRIEGVLETGRATWDSELLLFPERSGYAEESYHTFSYSPLRDEAAEVVGVLCVVSEVTEKVIGERRMGTLRELGSDLSVVRTERQMLDFTAEQLGRNTRDLPFTVTYLSADGGRVRRAVTSGVPEGHALAPDELDATENGLWPAAAVLGGDSVVVDLSESGVTDVPTGAWREPPMQALVLPLLQQGDSTPAGLLVAGLNRHRPLDAAYRGFLELVAGHIAAGVGSARSFRAQQQRAEELAELDRAKTTFFSNVSHEFRTPLTLIMGPVDDLRQRPTGLDDDARRELDLIHRNGSRLSKLVNTLLDFSRIQAGRVHARFEPVDLGQVTAELASVFRSAFDRAGLAFVVDCPSPGAAVYVDRDMWEKVMLNLLSNAMKYTLDGSVEVRVRADGDEATVTVADTGIGIAAGDMTRLFERFHRVESAGARSTEGSGIGLALVKELVNLHGGSISADSEFGRGTTFTVRLPFGAAHLPAEEVGTAAATRAVAGNAHPYVQEALRWLPDSADAPPAAVPVPVNVAEVGDRTRVLVADDNADMRDYLVHLLRGAGYHVNAVHDGEQALAAVRESAPDIVVSDVMMPKLDGLQLVAALRSAERTAALPVLLLSARAGQEASIEGLDAGADDYLVKPFAAAELLARVRANVELARLRSRHARWRAALVDSLQEAFFVCDEDGAVVEINTAFAEILGYGVDGLPYPEPQPWWPDADDDPEGFRLCAEALAGVVNDARGTYTVPVRHRDGHRLWITLTFNSADSETGQRVMVGTFRDVTAEHYAVQRSAALAELDRQLAQADTLDAAISGAAEAVRAAWSAHSVLAFTFPTTDVSDPTTPADATSAGAHTDWAALSVAQRDRILALGAGDPLTVSTERPGSTGVALHQPRGVLVLWVELGERRPFSAADQTLLAALAGRLGQGLQRLHRFDEQRQTALALQHAMLGPTILPGGFAVRYLPASRPLQIGGDWYDVVDLSDGRIGLIVGDCVGHGLEAATVMGQLRSACRALLLENPSPAAALTGLDRFAAVLPGAEGTTALCAVLDPGAGDLVYASAGHPPPVVVRRTGGYELLEGGRGLPLAVRPGRKRTEATAVLAPRATLLLYTDGLVERRGEAIDDGIARVASVLMEAAETGLADAADSVVSVCAPDSGYQDDVALLAYRQPAPLALEFPATMEVLSDTRAELRSWLDRSGIEPELLTDVLIAAGEAVSNSVEHGHRDRPGGPITLHADTMGNRLRITVTDTGTWKPRYSPPGNTRGRGIDLMRGLMHDVEIQSGDTGTTVHLTARIT